MSDIGIKAIAAAIAIFASAVVAIGEAFIVMRSVDGIARNPEAGKNIRSTMIVGVALVETGSIFALLTVIFIIFIL